MNRRSFILSVIKYKILRDVSDNINFSMPEDSEFIKYKVLQIGDSMPYILMMYKWNGKDWKQYAVLLTGREIGRIGLLEIVKEGTQVHKGNLTWICYSIDNDQTVWRSIPQT